MEASRSLGIDLYPNHAKIILPQAIKIMIPSFVNQFVISLKDTTIISVIGVVELLQTGKIIVARTTQSTYVYLIVAVMYLIVITALTKLAKVFRKEGEINEGKNLSRKSCKKNMGITLFLNDINVSIQEGEVVLCYRSFWLRKNPLSCVA